jgi:hypothetical protein
MEGEWLNAAEYRRRREMAALAERRRIDEQKRDPAVEQALIAWIAGGRVTRWELFLREWLQSRGEYGIATGERK